MSETHRRPSRRFVPTEAQSNYAPLVVLHSHAMTEEQAVDALFRSLNEAIERNERLLKSAADPVRGAFTVALADIEAIEEDATRIGDRYSPGGGMHEIADRLFELADRMRRALPR